MATNSFLPLNQFTFIVEPPETRTNAYYVNIYPDGRFNLNGKLTEKLSGKPIEILFTKDAKNLCLRDGTDFAIQFPKNGSKKLQSVIDHLRNQRIRLPAKYYVRYNEDAMFWQGDLLENPIQIQHSPSSKKKS